ncbi:MAG: hypothetical protein C5B56_12610, partial [Proteobacteria bacterium]
MLRADVTGSILGVVRDRSQGVVGGAKILALNVQTNLKQETVSGADGSFRILALPAGTYRLTVNAAGFRPFVEDNIVVQVNDQLHFDVTLDVGSVTDTVEISANTVQVQTENTQLGDVIDSKKMLALPLNGRSYLDLLGLQAGVAPTTAGTIQQDRPVSGFISNPGNVSVNGQRETANAFLVNGGDVSEGRNLGAGLVPNLDSVEEFRLITNSFDAEYGKFSGAVMNAITKSGTNGLHGDVFEFVRNDKFDANDYFANASQLPKTELRRNQFGYAVGGPFWKNKLFWFTDYQGTRQVQGATTGLVFLPSADQRLGNFDPMTFTTTDGNGNPAPTTVDGPYFAQQLSQRLGYTVTSGEPYAVLENGTGNGVVPCTTTAQCVFPGGVIAPPGSGVMSAWAVPAIKTLSYIPAPNIDPSAGTYSDNSQRNRVSDNKYGQRVDLINQTTGNWSWYYHYDYSDVNSALPAASVPGFPSQTLDRAQQFVMSNTKTFGPTSVNEARITFFRTALRKDKPTGSFASLSDLGFGTSGDGIIPSTTPGYPQYMPQMYFKNFFIGVPTLNTNQPNTTYSVSDGFSRAHGRHTWKFGGEFRYLQVNERNYASPNGNFVFDGSETGVDFADYLLGAPAKVGGYTQAALQVLDSRTRYGGAYVQDSWKAKPNLTLNLGLRWEVSMPWYDTQGKIQAIVPGLQSTVFPLAPPGLNFPGDPGIPKTIAPTKYNNFGPRLGLAYSPDFSEGALSKIFGGPGKTSIRAAFGLYYTSIEDLNLFYEVADAPFGLYWSTPVPVEMDLPFQIRTTGQDLGQRFPYILPTPGAASNKTLDFSVFEPFTYYPGYDIHNKLPYAEHFNLSIQRELSKSTVLTLAYVGTEGHRLITQMEANQGDAALCQKLTAQGYLDVTADPTGGAVGCGPYAENDVFQSPTAATPCFPPAGQPASPTPLPGCVYSTRNVILNPNYCPGNVTLVCFGANNTYTRLVANSIYNAGQITVERKANNLTFLAAYTFAKGLDNSSAFNDLINFQDARLSRGLSSTDITHNFVVSYIWSIPFDRAFQGAPKRLTQGWQLQGITRFSTGFPVALNQSFGDLSLAGISANDMPNRVGNVVIVNPRKVNTACPTYDPTIPGSGTGCYFLPSAFAENTTPGTFGTADRRFFHGPGFNNTDFG